MSTPSDLARTGTGAPVIDQLHAALSRRGRLDGVDVEADAALRHAELCGRVGRQIADLLATGARPSWYAGTDDPRELITTRLPECVGIVREVLASMIDDIVSRDRFVLRNLTPHPVAVHTPQGIVEIRPSGDVARCVENELGQDQPTVVFVGGRPVTLVTDRTTSMVVGLPTPAPDVLFVVSRLVALTAPERTDLVFPNSPVRDETGRIIGCRCLARLSHSR